jgi:hypothetical protein
LTTGTFETGSKSNDAPHRERGDCGRFPDVARSTITKIESVLGWTRRSIRTDDERPFARIDRMGLVWLLNGDRLLAMTADAAVVERRAVAITALNLDRLSSVAMPHRCGAC